MEFPQDQIEELRSLYPGVSKCDEGGATFFLIPQLAMPDGCDPPSADALLSPTPRGDGYPSRLYLASQIATPTQRNWNGNIRILERNWHACSWKVNVTLRLVQQVAAHLKAFR